MMKNDDIIILGGNFLGLYCAFKCVENGYKNISIIDKKLTLGDIKTNNYMFFHANHTLYIELLNTFNIKYSSLSIEKNMKVQNVLNSVITRSKFIPYKILISQSFACFCKSTLSSRNYNMLVKNISNFENIYSRTSAFDAIDMFITDINIDKDYYKLDDDINILIKNMIEYLISNNVKFIQNDIYDFKYNNNKFILYNKESYHNYTCDILLTTLSKKKLLCFKFWNLEQRILLNSSTNYNLDIRDIFKHVYILDDKKNLNNDTNTYILEQMRLVFPQSLHYLVMKKKYLSFWNIGINNIFTRDKIKNIYNKKFVLCSDSYAKNNVFINYSFELFYYNFSKILILSCASKTT